MRNNSSKSITIILIGNKKDLEDRRQVTYEEGEALAKENGLMFLEASAKTAYNVVESFNLSAQSILNSMQKDGFDPNVNSNIKINNENNAGGIVEPNKKNGGCC